VRLGGDPHCENNGSSLAGYLRWSHCGTWTLVTAITRTYLRNLMKKWTTTLQVKMENHRIISNLFRIQRGIYQGDSLSPLWFCLALNPLSYLLNRTNYGFGIHSGNQEMQWLNHLNDELKMVQSLHFLVTRVYTVCSVVQIRKGV